MRILATIKQALKGEKNPEAAAFAGAQALILSIFLSFIIGGLGVYFAADILRLMGASPEVVAEGAPFARTMLGGSIAVVLIFLLNGIFRGAGDAAMAIATVIGRSTGIFYQCYHLFKGDLILKFTRKSFVVHFETIKAIVKIAWPATFQFIIASGSWILITRLVALTGGTAASAGCQIAFRNFAFFILPAWGLSNAAATLVGQNLGAKEIERAEQSVYIATKYNVIFMVFVTLLFWIFPEAIIRVFSNDPDVVAHGIEGLKVIGSGYVLYAIAMVMTQALNGAGDTKTPTIINIICFWLFQTPLAYFLAITLDLKSLGALVAVPIAQTVVAAVAWYYFKKGNWKTIKV